MACENFWCAHDDDCEILYNVGFCDCACVGDCEMCKDYHTCDKKFEDEEDYNDWSDI